MFASLASPTPKVSRVHGATLRNRWNSNRLRSAAGFRSQTRVRPNIEDDIS